MNGVINGVSVIFGVGVVAGMLACIVLMAAGIVIDGLLRRYGRYVSKDLLPEKINPVRARNADEAAYIEGVE